MKSMFLALTLFATSALAQEAPSGQAWSVVGPRTVEPGGNVIELAAGFPGLSFSYLRGVAPALNLGVRAGFTYGVEGLIRDVLPGVKLQGLVKVRFFDTNQVSLGLTFEPGPFFASPWGGTTRVGFSLPIGLRLGIAASSAVTLAILVDAPLWVEFGPAGGFNAPLLSGVGIEYFVTSKVSLFFRTRLGPTIRPYRVAEFTFDGALGVGFRF